jgi:hypothetical protein
MAVYIINEPSSNFCKIGMTLDPSEKKLKKRYQTSLSSGIEIKIFEHNYPYMIEKLVHNELAEKNISLEIFNITPSDAELVIKKIMIEYSGEIELPFILRFLPYKHLQTICKLFEIKANSFHNILFEEICKKKAYEIFEKLKLPELKKIYAFICKKKVNTKWEMLQNLFKMQSKNLTNYSLAMPSKKLEADIKKKYKIYDLQLYFSYYGADGLNLFSKEVHRKIFKK